ncbi:MAG: polysaccharide deacetylase family protein [Saprospiraceae bacterium]|nr:polysaccharide deacetylase family protein [Saprospiraceae bacterium]MBP7699396.1 polysaccharide deacetylase family protein [Saprospiraceae bacterium]
MYLVKTPRVLQSLLPNYLWKMPAAAEKTLYLTFDDGPVPEVTPWVLDQLAQYDAKGTFFCVGENVKRYPEIFQRVVQEGHTVGNHTFNHLNGWDNDNLPYFLNIRQCAKLVASDLFRPPYGKLRLKQMQFLQRHYQIVMWDVLSGDFDASISKEKCLSNVVQNGKDGSIIVFHDSVKAEHKLRYVLPQALAYFSDKGYKFDRIRQSNAVANPSILQHSA